MELCLRRIVGLGILLLAASVARADRMRDLAEIHLVALGGAERVAALGALRAEGRVFAAGRLMTFTLWAPRPDRIRLETVDGLRKTVQAQESGSEPWESDLGKETPTAQPMAAAAAKIFTADAEFDDPLVAGESRGFTLDFAGETEVDGRKLLRVLVTRQLTSSFQLLIDAESYIIVMRVEERDGTFGRKRQVVTRYDNYLPINGVLLPHRLTTLVDGKATQEIRIDRITANPALAADLFSRPPPPPPPAEPPAEPAERLPAKP